MATKAPLTYPAPKYQATPIFGTCEVENCESNARTACGTCDGHFCLGHASHESPAPSGHHIPD